MSPILLSRATVADPYVLDLEESAPNQGPGVAQDVGSMIREHFAEICGYLTKSQYVSCPLRLRAFSDRLAAAAHQLHDRTPMSGARLHAHRGSFCVVTPDSPGGRRGASLSRRPRRSSCRAPMRSRSAP